MENKPDSSFEGPIEFADKLFPNNYSLSEQNLRQLILILHQVSQKKEEGRFPNFLVWVCNKDSQMPFLSVKFEKSIDVTVENLHRLFPAISPRPYAIIIDPESKNLRMMGMARIEYSGFAFHINRGFEFNRSSAFPGLIVGVEAPATLSAVHYSAIPPYNIIHKFELREGKILKSDSGLSISVSSVMCARIGEVLQRKSLNSSSVRPMVNGTWSRMITTASELRHGGMYIVIPHDITHSQLEEQVNIGHRTIEPQIGQSIVDIHGGPIEKMQTFIDKWEARVKLAAQISAVDGAVVLDWNFNILSFRNVIDVKGDSELPICYKMEGFTAGNKIDLKNFGTRHQSAARLCAKLKGVAAIVISQDGEIREFMQLNDGKLGVCGPLRQIVGETFHP